MVFRALLSLRYRIVLVGFDALAPKDERGILFLPNHPALIDPFILFCVLVAKYDVRPLAGRGQIERPGVSWLADRVRVRKIPDATETAEGKQHRIAAMLHDTVRSLNAGEALVVYPSGQLYRQPREQIANQGAVAFLTHSCPSVRVVLVRTSGLWGSSFGHAGRRPPTVAGALKRGLLGLLKSGLLFMPRRQVRIEFRECPDFPRGGTRSEVNRFLEAFYNAADERHIYVPYSPWERGGTRVVPEAQQAETS
ncbi:MAG: 1-acyl-sn-glycerol-3-phosphate acyltransferase [Polyangiaceae bacterium]|nr:1-acyl-sn-glycerol-3-phosphate acyltransferase [Polyangiaceae bacterium]